MPARTSMPHLRVDDQPKTKAADTPAGAGLTLPSNDHQPSEAETEAETDMPGLTTGPEAHDAWFRAGVREALDDPHPTVPHERVMSDLQALIDGKRRA